MTTAGVAATHWAAARTVAVRRMRLLASPNPAVPPGEPNEYDLA